MKPVNPPRLLTRRDLIKQVATRWRTQYFHLGTWGRCCDGSSQVVYEKLMALNLKKVKREEIDKIIGNNSWTELTCEGCRRDVDAAVEVGELPDYNSATVTLCAFCIASAAKLLRGSHAK